MNLFLCMCTIFAIGSMSGWVLELFFRRFVSSKKWINPGFLVGPCLPLYGFGVLGLYLISHFVRFDIWFNLDGWVNNILVIVIMTIAMTVIEYIAGLIFIKGMGIKLWDYSKRWGNIQGIICPLFSLFWGVIAALFHFFVTGFLEKIINGIASYSIGNGILFFILGMFYGILIIDFAYSLKLTQKIREYAKKYNIVVRYEEFKENIRETHEKAKQKISFLLPFKSDTPLSEHLASYFAKIKDEVKEIKNKAFKNNDKKEESTDKDSSC